MGLKKQIADFLIKGCGLRKLHDTAMQRVIRSVLDEIDLQHLKDVHRCQSFSGREEMYKYVHESCIHGAAMDYLEFGVYEGDSIKCWTDLNVNAESRFFGFDSFAGLPERWREGRDKGHFDVGGAMPQLNDPRVSFIKGWFENTLPPFVRSFTAQNHLVVHLDADLYGSTMLPLLYLSPFMPEGTLLIFDEFDFRDHEFKALMDWQKIFHRKFKVIAQVDNYSQVSVRLL